MKIRLITARRVFAPAGTEIELEASQAALLIAIGAAEKVEDKAPAKKKKSEG